MPRELLPLGNGSFQINYDSAYRLMAAAHFTAAFGEAELAEQYRQTAGALKAAMATHLFSRHHGRFPHMVTDDPQGTRHADPTIDTSLAGLCAFGAFDTTDPRVVATMEAVCTRLWVQTEVGGLARYENDTYQQVSRETTRIPGNPWIICTLWLAEWEIARVMSEADLAIQAGICCIRGEPGDALAQEAQAWP